MCELLFKNKNMRIMWIAHLIIQLNITLTKEIKKASVIIGLKKHLQQNQKLQYLAKQKKIPIYVVNRSSIYQITKLIQFIVS